MKQSDSSATVFPSLFQIAAFFDDFFPAGGFNQPMAAFRHLPFAELMSSPEKLMAALKSNQTEAGAAEPRAKSPKGAKRPTRGAASKRGESGNGGGNGGGSHGGLPDPAPLKKVEFILQAPAANSVKLAADFTDWERSPVEMMHSEDGTWFTVVPLAPGQYAYRYIVDGQWYDDPACPLHAPNPFGTENAVVRVQ